MAAIEFIGFSLSKETHIKKAIFHEINKLPFKNHVVFIGNKRTMAIDLDGNKKKFVRFYTRNACRAKLLSIIFKKYFSLEVVLITTSVIDGEIFEFMVNNDA